MYRLITIIILAFYAPILFSEGLPYKHLGEREKKVEKENFDDPILLTLAKNLGHVQNILQELLREDDHYNIPFESPIIYPRWKFVTGPLLQLDVGLDGTLMGVKANKKIFTWEADRLKNIGGLVSQISVGDKKHICAIGPGSNIFKLNQFKKWQSLRGRAKYISCASDGTIVGIYTDQDAKKSKLKLGSLVIRKKRKWVNLPGQLDIISAGAKNNIWGLKTSGSVWFFNGKRWDRKPGSMKYISAAQDGTVAAVGKNGGAYLWDGTDWVNVSGVNLVLISTQGNGKYWAITSDGSVWKSLKE